jgi:hypothetical protein
VGPIIGLDAVAKREIPSPRWESNPDRPARSLVAIPTELSLLSNKVIIIIIRRRRRRRRR